MARSCLARGRRGRPWRHGFHQ